MAKSDDMTTWQLIHRERTSMANTLAALTPEQWAAESLCAGWSVRVMAAHIVMAAEQTPGHFFTRMAANGFRFNTMMDRDSRQLGTASPDELVSRLRARLTTTNHPPAPVMAMLGEIVIHSEDIRYPLGIASDLDPEAVRRCLDMYTKANFPVGGKKRIAGLRLSAPDLGWSYGEGPEVSGPGISLALAMTGRSAVLPELAGDGLPTFSSRFPRPATAGAAAG